MEVHPDCRKTLEALRSEWEACRRCELGVYRDSVQGSFVFGEGAPGGVMFIGEGPGKDEEKEGRPFVGMSGMFLRNIIDAIGFDRYYITNTVSCRSWVYDYDGEGKPRLDFKTREPRRKDEKPTTAHALACNPRLAEEIYIVDPILIVALGGSAAETLLGRSVTMQNESGEICVAEIPGATLRPKLTPKGNWARKVGPKGDRKLVWPSEQNKVQYPLIPLFHPAHAMAHEQDKRPGSPMHLFAIGMKKAYDLYTRYMHEVHGGTLAGREVTEQDIYGAQEDEGTGYR